MRSLIQVAVALCASSALAGPIDDARLDYIAGNYQAALEVLIPAAEAGDANAQNIVGDAYDVGNGVDIDYNLARDWWTKSADQGFSKALYNLGKMLSEGRDGLEPDYEEAKRRLTESARKANGDAFNELGLMHALGRGGPVDHAKSIEFYMKGHELGSTIATSNLGAVYAAGQGVEVDYAKAFELSTIAAERGDGQANHNLGVMYRDGLHVSASPWVAFLMFREAQAQGYPKAGMQMADMMLVESSPRHDPVTALGYCQWSEIVASPAQQADLFMDCAALAAELTDAQQAVANAITEDLLQ
ncbi:MAG: tetratricopeptide repeat protein [Pseudomonadota bacterium]